MRLEQVAEVLALANPMHYLSLRQRRDLYGVISSAVFPSEVRDPNGSLQRAEQLLDEGYSLAVATRHFSNADFFVLAGTYRRNSSITQNGDGERHIIIPLAYHMQGPGAKGLFEFFGVTAKTIVTEETVKKGKNKNPSGKELKEGYGFLGYAKTSADELEHGGLVFMAPSATRRALHEPWEKKPIEVLVNLTEQSNKTAFMTVGLDMVRANDYAKRRGYNLFRKFIVTMGPLYTKQQLLEEAEQRGISVDRVMADDMAQLVRPETLGERYAELRTQRLAQRI